MRVSIFFDGVSNGHPPLLHGAGRFDLVEGVEKAAAIPRHSAYGESPMSCDLTGAATETSWSDNRNGSYSRESARPVPWNPLTDDACAVDSLAVAWKL